MSDAPEQTALHRRALEFRIADLSRYDFGMPVPIRPAGNQQRTNGSYHSGDVSQFIPEFIVGLEKTIEKPVLSARPLRLYDGATHMEVKETFGSSGERLPELQTKFSAGRPGIL